MLNNMSNWKVMMRMITLVKPLMGWMFIAITFGVIGFLCAIFIPVTALILVAQQLQLVYLASTSNLIIFMIVIAILRGILHYIEQACNHYIAFTLLAILRDKVFVSLRKLAPAKLEGQDKGNLISIITSDIELLEVFYAHTISPIAIAILTSGILVICFYFIEPIFALIALCAYITVGVCIPFKITRLGKEDGNEYREAFGDLNAYTLETIRGLQDILQYQSKDIRMKEMQKRSEHLNTIQKNLRRFEGKSMAYNNMAVHMFTLILLFVGLTLFVHGGISFYAVLIGSVLLMSSFGPVIALSNLSNNLLHTLASGRRVIALLDEQPQVEDVVSDEESSVGDIELDHLSFAYDNEVILKDVNEKFKQGEITGILGKSGSGKSTLLRLIMRFWDVKDGSISIDKKNIKQIDTKDLRQMQSFVTQDTILFHDTIEENLRIAKRNASIEEIMEACKKASIHNFIMGLEKGYQSHVGELGDTLSGGEKQRIGIARAFLHDSDCILLDEPTSNLDALNEAVILKSLRQVKGKTVILVSHRVSTLKICDHILPMKEGRVS